MFLQLQFLFESLKTEEMLTIASATMWYRLNILQDNVLKCPAPVNIVNESAFERLLLEPLYLYFITRNNPFRTLWTPYTIDFRGYV